MASSSETAEKKSEVCPTEDLILALIEKLVDPRLPFRVSKNDPPNLSVQQAVAKQMHAVVLLYNYYYRKQHPNIEFLEFTAFCKLSVILRQTMIAFMKFMNQGDSMEPNDLKDGLSVTEKAIRDACKISIALDALKDVPNMEGWPISKVAVLLIDSKRENCLLQFGSFTEGVWSLIEKEIDESNISSKISVEKTAGNKRKRNSGTPRTENNADDKRFLQLAFSAVKEVTGITNSDLVILETHVVYSLSKEKTATRFYMMQCPQSISENERVPVEDVVKSSQGPLVEKICGSWTITAVVEYYHMHPYAAIISNWFTRTCSPMPSLDDSKSQSTKEFSGRRILNMTERSTINKFVDHVENMCSPTIDNSCAKLANENNYSDNKCKHSSSVKDAGTVNISQVTGKDHNSMNKCNPTYENINSAQNGVHNNDEVLNLNGGKECLKGSSPGLPSVPHKIEDVGNNQISKLKVYHKKKNFSSMQIDASPPRGCMKLEVAMVDSLKSNDIQGTDDKVSGENCCVTSSSNQSGIPLASAEPVPLEANKKHTKEVQNTQGSETLENALILLYRRRQELYSQICSMEDELALCEGNIERIRGGDEVSLADEHVKPVVSGRSSICSKSENQAGERAFQLGEGLGESQWKLQMGLSGALVPGNSSCQALEFMCLKNNWRLPRYFAEPSDGEFISEVVLKGNDFKFSSKGDLKNTPRESRESSAARIIAKLRNFCM